MSKGKATRSSTATSSTPAPAPTINNDILTGRLTENDWQVFTDVEDGEEFVTDILGAVLKRVDDYIYEKYIDESLLPFSLSWVERMIVDLIDWQFLSCDKGELVEEEANWLPDEEAPQQPLDSWSRGLVPQRIEEIPHESSPDTDDSMELEPQEAEIVEEDALSEGELMATRNNPDLLQINEYKRVLKQFRMSSDDILTLCKLSESKDDGLNLLFNAIHILQHGTKQRYDFKKAIENINEIAKFAKKFRVQNIPEDKMQLLKRFMEDMRLHPDHFLTNSSKAAVGLCTWLHAVYNHQLMSTNLNLQTTYQYLELKGCLLEMKACGSPPIILKNVTCAVVSLLLRSIITNFAEAQKRLNVKEMLIKIDEFDCLSLSEDFIKKYKQKFLKYEVLQVEQVSKAASIIYKWCHQQIYGYGSVIVRPPEPKLHKPKRSPEVKQLSESCCAESLFDAERKDTIRSSLKSNVMMMPQHSAAMLKTQQGRPPGPKDVMYDDIGNVISVSRIKPNKIPSNKVKTKYEVIDPKVIPKYRTKKLNPIRNGKMPKNHTFLIDTPQHTPLPPAFVDAVQASPGVVIRQGNRVKHGPSDIEDIFGPSASFIFPVNS